MPVASESDPSYNYPFIILKRKDERDVNSICITILQPLRFYIGSITTHCQMPKYVIE